MTRTNFPVRAPILKGRAGSMHRGPAPITSRLFWCGALLLVLDSTTGQMMKVPALTTSAMLM